MVAVRGMSSQRQGALLVGPAEKASAEKVAVIGAYEQTGSC